MRLLGLSAFHHDSAAALVEDGRIVAAAQEERFTRKRHDAGFPAEAIRYCLAAGKIDLDQVDYVVFFEKPLIKFERLLETYLANAPRGFASFKMAIPLWIKEKLFQKSNLEKALTEFAPSGKMAGRLLFAEHHQSHAASAFFPSPFDEAVVPTMDGVGEWATTSVSIGKGNTLTPQREIHWPHSVGLLYSALTYHTGFKVNSGEYKVMGLAPYGEPRYAQAILDHIVDLREEGSFWLDQTYFNYATGLTMTSGKFHDLFGGPPRSPETWLTQREMDLTASVQKVTEEIFLRVTSDLARRMQFGPRALGARSILGDPRNPNMQKNLNLKIEYRESFLPFAPSVLREDVADYFDLDIDSPYMLLVADVKCNRRRTISAEEEALFGIDKLNVVRSDIPAVTHVDYSARVQTVHAETNPRYHALLSPFKRRTGCTVLVNTSFNVRGEPIVCSPEDAFRCFMGTGMETLIAGNCVLHKAEQNQRLA